MRSRRSCPRARDDDSVLVAIASRTAAACVVVVAAGAGFWLVAVGVDAPGFLGPGFGPNASSFASQWPFVLAPEVLLVTGAALAIVGGFFSTSRRACVPAPPA